MPAHLLRGLIPAALLSSHDFWQETGASCRLTGYGTSEVLVELLPCVAILGSGMEGDRYHLVSSVVRPFRPDG